MSFKHGLFSLLLGICPVGFAINGYQFELIIFSHINATNYNSEKWPATDELPFSLGSAQAVDPAISSKEFTLQKELDRLKKYSRYKIILHLAWQESLQQLNKNPLIHIYGGRLYDEQGHTLKTIEDESIPYEVDQNWEIDGTLSIALVRYFDLDFNLRFALPYQQVVAYQQKTNNTSTFYYVTLQQKRRTKSRELNYIDHPLYGILMKITPSRGVKT